MGTLLIQSTRMSRPTAFAVVAVAAAGAQLVAAQAGFSSLPYPGITPFNHTCSLDTVYSSCPEQNYTSVDSCCTETFGGLVLATQFWDTYTGLESEGQLLPKEAWTLHGLWPDFCNGSYTGYCDVSRQYDPEPSPNVSSTGVELQPYTGNVTMTGVLQKFGRLDLLAYMEKYWVSQGSSSESFWAHEVSKHATCYSNYQTACWGPQYQEHAEVANFLETAVNAYKMYPTYEWLAAAGITPSNSTTYSLGQIEDALTKASGAKPYIGCSGPRYNTTAAGNGTTDSGRTVISELWYYNHAFGRIDNLNLTAVPSTSNSSCATTDKVIHYYARGNGTEWSA